MQKQHDFLYWKFGDRTAVRQGKWRAVKPVHATDWELYDLNADPAETKNLATTHPHFVRKLADLAAKPHSPVQEGTFASTDRHEGDRRATFGKEDDPTFRPTAGKKKADDDTSRPQAVDTGHRLIVSRHELSFVQHAEPTPPRTYCYAVEEPLNRRITAAQLMAMKHEPTAAAQIAALLGVDRMPPNLATKTVQGIAEFLAQGDATAAAQLIHASLVRRRRKSIQART